LSHEIIQYHSDLLVGLPPGVGDKQVIKNADQFLMSIVDGLDVDTVIRRPLEKISSSDMANSDISTSTGHKLVIVCTESSTKNAEYFLSGLLPGQSHTYT
jgi:hypothetical protein